MRSVYSVTSGCISSLVAGVVVAVQPPPASPDDHQRDAAVYILVIDHSTSMIAKDKADSDGKPITRWEYMQNLATKFVEDISLNNRVWVFVFGGYEGGKLQLERRLFPLKDDNDRRIAADYIRRYASPPQNVGTALCDTLVEAFKTAADESDHQPGIYIRIMVYTDGEDTHSRSKDNSQAFNDLVLKNDNTWLFFTPLDLNQPFDPPCGLAGDHIGIGTPKHPVPLNVSPSRLTLANPKNSASQVIRLELDLSPEHAKLLDGQLIRLAFESDNVQVGPLERLSPKPGPASLTFQVSNAHQLRLDESYTGRIRLTAPELPSHEVQITPPEGIAVSFQEAGKLKIEETGPMNDAVHAVRKEIRFFARTLQGATVTWDFGDGTKDVGDRIAHAYDQDGDFNVIVKASAEGFQDADPVTIPLKIVDIGAHIDKPTYDVLAGELIKLACKGHGPIKRFEWSVDGTTKGSKEELIETRFDQPGDYPLTVRAISDYGVFRSPEVILSVLPKPTLALIAPATGSAYSYMDATTFVANVTGKGIAAVNFTITRQQDRHALLDGSQGSVKVVAENGRGTATLVHNFHESETKDEPITLTAAAVLPEDYKIQPPLVQMTLPPPRFQPRIVIMNPPKDGAFHVDDPVNLKIENPSAHQIKHVVWNLGDGTTKKGPETEIVHHYAELASKNKPYRVTASVMTVSHTEPTPAIPTPPISVIPRPLYVCALGMAAIALLVGWRMTKLCTGNGPRAWSVCVSRDKDKFPPFPQAKLKDFWSRERKHATISMSALMRRSSAKSQYWTHGEGKKAHVVVARVGSGKEGRGVIRFSDEGNGAVTFQRALEETRNTRVWELFDDRAPEEDSLRHIYLQLKEEVAAPVGDYVVLGITFVALILAVAFTAHYTYFSRL
jgi:hypothetical protein